MKLLVTGGAGYIGSITAARLLAEGHQVTIADNLSTGHLEAVPDGAELVEVDLLDREAVTAALAGPFDAVLHFAAKALVAESMEKPELYWRVNVGGSLNLLDAMRETGVRMLVFSSTCAVYGEPDRMPIAEDVPPRPTNPYGASKLAVDEMISFEAARHGLAAASLRYFNVAGASNGLGEDHRPETHLIPLVLQAAAGIRTNVEVLGTDYPTPDGTAVRDYVHVEDLARAHVLALGATRPGRHQVLNLGSGRGFSVREVIDAAREVTGRSIETVDGARRPGDPPVLVASNERIRASLGWRPGKPDLRQMIGDAWEFVQARPQGYGRGAV